VAGGRRTSFEDFVLARGQALQRFGYLLTSDWELAEYLVRTAFARAYSRWPRLKIGAREAHLRKIMINTWSSWWRGRWRGALPGEALPSVATAGQHAGAERGHAVTSALAGLPQRQRLVLVLRFHEDLSEQQVADLLAVSVGTVESQAVKALASLRAGGALEGSLTPLRHGRQAPEVDVASDEARARDLLDVMTSGQPDAPPDRYAGIVLRARRNGLTRAAATLGVATVVAAAAIGTGVSARRTTLLVRRPVPGWALPWPDHRNGSVPQRVLDGAVTAWRHDVWIRTGVPFGRTEPRKVIWYVGQTVASGQAVAVIFEVDSSAGRRLVAGWAATAQVLEGQPAWTVASSPWVLFDAAVPRPSARLRIGLNLHGTAVRPGPNSDSWIVLLAPPDVWSMTYTWMAAPCCLGGKLGHGKASRGLLVADVGQLGSRVRLMLPGAGGVDHPSGYVGVPGNAESTVPQLAHPAPVGARPGFRAAGELTGQGTSHASLPRSRGRLAILARCYGPSSLHVTYGSGPWLTSLGTVPCDDRVHELATGLRLRVAHAGIGFDTSALTAYRVLLGTVR